MREKGEIPWDSLKWPELKWREREQRDAGPSPSLAFSRVPECNVINNFVIPGTPLTRLYCKLHNYCELTSGRLSATLSLSNSWSAQLSASNTILNMRQITHGKYANNQNSFARTQFSSQWAWIAPLQSQEHVKRL